MAPQSLATIAATLVVVVLAATAAADMTPTPCINPGSPVAAVDVPVSASYSLPATTPSVTGYSSCGPSPSNYRSYYPSAWFSLTGTGQRLSVSTCGTDTNFDTILTVFSGKSDGECPETCVANNDDDNACGPSSRASTTTFYAESGETYYVMVWGYNGASGTYDLVIESDCANSTAIVPVDVNSPVSISVDTDSPNLRAVTCQDVNVSTSLPTGGWYSFVGDGNPALVSTCGYVTPATTVSIFTSPCSDQQCLAAAVPVDDSTYCNEGSKVAVSTVMGTTYYILVSGTSAAATGVATLAVYTDVDPTCAATIDMTQASFPLTISGSTAPDGASNVDVPYCDGMTISSDSEVMAYAVYADDDGRLTFSTCSTLTTFDTKIMVFRDADDGGDVAQGVLNRGCLDLCMGSNDDDYSCGPNTLASTVTVDVQGGETYIVLVSGYASYSYGSFELSISWAKGLTTGTVAAIVIPLGACACCMLLLLVVVCRRKPAERAPAAYRQLPTAQAGGPAGVPRGYQAGGPAPANAVPRAAGYGAAAQAPSSAVLDRKPVGVAPAYPPLASSPAGAPPAYVTPVYNQRGY